MAPLHIAMDGLLFPESPRWHDGRLWFSDWGTGEVIALAPDGAREVITARGPSFPMCIDFLPDGRLLLVSAAEGRVLCRQSDGSFAAYADLSALSGFPWNDITSDSRGNVYVNNVGFDFPGGEFAPGTIALIRPDGSSRQVADGIAFPNGMAVTPGGETLIVAESYGERLTAFTIGADGGLSRQRVWAGLNGDAPDGISIDAHGDVWYADVPHKRCVRVREGGEVLQTVELDRGCFACALSGDGETLYVTANDWHGVDSMRSGARRGQIVAVDVQAAAVPSRGDDAHA